MRAWLAIARLGRPALAVAALYALVLGTFLPAFATLPAATAGQHVLCSPDADGAPGRHPGEAPARECCTLACPGGTPPLTPSAAVFVPTPPVAAEAIGWTLPPDTLARGPARFDLRSRGPPLA